MHQRDDEIDFARYLRRTGNTYEDLLWQLLRNRKRLGAKFRRQDPIGAYVVDFYCAAAKLVVEVDGKHHLTEEGRKHDEVRDRWMQRRSIRILRFTGKQVEYETEQVLYAIEEALKSAFEPLTPRPPLPQNSGNH